MAYWLCAARNGQEHDHIQRFDPRFWTVNFPRPMMASVVTIAPDALRLTCEFHHAGELAGLIWESEDRLDHPLHSYATDRDYSHTVLSFQWRSGGVIALDAVNGPTLTIEGRDASGTACSWYVRLWNYAEGSPEDALVTTDIGNTCSITNGYLRFNGPRQHLAALIWGNCGFAYGCAMGAKIGKPDAPVFAIQGDGAWGISGLSEVMTAVREDIPVVAIVINNHEWGAEKKNQIDFYGDRFVGVNLPDNPDFAKVAEAMGAKGFTVEDYQDVQDVVREAIASGKPCVINAVVEGGEKVLAEPFRRDALEMPTRHLDKYAHLSLE